jgi:LacI family repressor for deo operon, udp, cdd, tsx, nupC, and nupG
VTSFPTVPRPSAAASMDDVARAAGVSTATVSRALRGLSSVSAATRDRIQAVARELGYVASPSAASLASGRTRSIGLLTPWVDRWFYAHAIDGAERALREVGFDALLYTFDLSSDQSRPRVDPSVLRRRVDGVLVVGMPMSREEVASLEALDLPLAFVGTGRHDHVTVRLDDDAAGRCATEHLLGLGHRRIGHITGPAGVEHSWSPPVARHAAWRVALEEASVAAEPGWAVDGAFDVNGGREAAHRLLSTHPEITALFAASDEMAMGAILAARERGIDVPGELSVIGIDGHDLGELVGLTTVAQDPARQGGEAAQLLLSDIALWAAPGAEKVSGALQVLHPTHLVVRSSTAPPRQT